MKGRIGTSHPHPTARGMRAPSPPEWGISLPEQEQGLEKVEGADDPNKDAGKRGRSERGVISPSQILLSLIHLGVHLLITQSLSTTHSPTHPVIYPLKVCTSTHSRKKSSINTRTRELRSMASTNEHGVPEDHQVDHIPLVISCP